ncbi:hypothetical protein [Rossellomorea sp. RS05]|uniref:hypothetical protein n=1 Tax=Rossellomorea sp. RS05 TaxID=3149166 RepID=UPI003221D9E9
MPYKVINDFTDTKTKTLYEKGDIYPLQGLEETPERISELQAVHPKYKRAFLAPEPLEAEPAEEVKPAVYTDEQLEALGAKALKELLDEKKISYKASATRPELIKLYKGE